MREATGLLVGFGLGALANAVAAGWVAGMGRWLDAALFVGLAIVNAYQASLWAGIRALRSTRRGVRR